MILSELREYLRLNGRAAVVDMAYHFDIEPDAVRGMLEHWIRKGKVRKLPEGAICGNNCDKCAPGTAGIYEWVG
uniref:FeoC like transcriptional regulator n=1 Tax=Candidatus Kentrum sp. TUN TaxID=2126343 RepID=A0A450ZBD3_9GAMM|nr:MAG: FeoC like transcriptional regulator [Candidatus Kentron sp. TUN]VFK52538.1 MAG: FeoC like transcriptional regulator [Candidatus Kentron sp. TUN]VFK52858.1 MAG: FeoC like transcriptional regulator [Candidatus Kentron sp. TUN]